MPNSQCVKYVVFYAALTGVSFRIGWWACNYVSDRIDNYKPRIGEGKYGW
ncbi:hypothetical protein [Mycobacteroides chelonae]|nr:hypothetical protein [Mycobacteroides chelonae]